MGTIGAAAGATVRAVIGTAGHVDHGKTTLVTHLTGIDTDRLKEEKERGISIELGFAWMPLSTGERTAIVDVPGHERFVRQMIAGAAGIDLVLLVVAADEGVMPQTQEHLDICELLGVRAGAVIITKTDLVDDEWLELVEDDVAGAVAGTFLEGKPIARYSAGDDAARDALRSLIEELLSEQASGGAAVSRSADRPLKLSVDRVFTMRGFGTVVTGTTASGSLSTGDTVELQPGGLRARVRSLQVHGETVARVGPGLRTAVNLQGVEHTQAHRGDVLVHAGELPPTSMFDATFRALSRLEEPVPERTRALIHVGTAQVEGTLAWVGTDRAEPGEWTAAQVRLDEPITLLPGEPFVVRGFTVLPGYGKTLGGGRVLCPVDRRHRKRDVGERAMIEALAGDDVPAMLLELVRFAEQRGVARDRLTAILPAEATAIDAALEELTASGALAIAAGHLFHEDVLIALGARAVTVVAGYHEQQPARAGILPEELRTRLRSSLSADLHARVVERLVRDGELTAAGDALALPTFTPRRTAAQLTACEAVMSTLIAGGLTPTRLADLPDELDLSAAAVDEALELLLMDSAVVRVTQQLFYAADHIHRLEAELRAFLREHGEIETGQFKLLTGASRKWTIPLQEYFDRIRLTLRVGDSRRLRET